MCGIIGVVSYRNVSSILLNGLKRLEYRGYDSAGMVVINNQHQFERHRTIGKVQKLEKINAKNPITGSTGIAHTRWATHGKPNEKNAHPHFSNNDVAIVHNGIIENNEIITHYLSNHGYQIESETDTELIAHLIYKNLQSHQDFLHAVQATIPELEGAFALGLIRKEEPGRLLAVRFGSPLVIGIGENENFIASDQLALLPLTKKFIYLEEGDIADIGCDKITIFNANHQPVERPIVVSQLDHTLANKGMYPHFMLKEIFEQPDAISSILEGRLTQTRILNETFGIKANKILKKIKRIQFVACGTSFHACLVAAYWLSEIANIKSQADIASEFRYQKLIVEKDTLFVTVSQSGETADTLAALRLAKKLKFSATLAICNVPESSIVRESDLVLMTRAGPEIGVASTKAFTTQLTGLLMLAITLAQFNHLTEQQSEQMIALLKSIPEKIQHVLETLNHPIKKLSHLLIDQKFILFLGRGILYPIALEGALKLREISYIPANAFPTGELKHGTIAIIETDMGIITLVPNDTHTLNKLKSNLQEILARSGKLIVISEEKTGVKSMAEIKELFNLPEIDRLISPIIYTIPLQLLAYYVAVFKGNDVDQPRHLAKSVTVE